MIQYRNIVLLLMIALLSGCTTLGSLHRRYDRIVFEDGINEKEARTIAQREYLLKDTARNYKVGSAKVYNGVNILDSDSDRIPFVRNEYIYTDYRKKLKFSDSWYVVFSPKFLSFFSTYYLIVMDKKDGSVLYEYESKGYKEMLEVG